MKSIVVFYLFLFSICMNSQTWMKIQKVSGGTDSIALSNIQRIYFSGHSNLPQDYVAFYPFNNSFNDESSNGLHLTPLGSPIFTTDRFNNPLKAGQFNGTSDYLKHDSTTLLKPKNTFTLCAWFKTESIDDESDVIISTLAVPDFGGYQLTLAKRPEFVIEGDARTPDTQSIRTSYDTPRFNKWNFVVYTYSVGVGQKLYLNGIRVAESSTAAQIVYQSNHQFFIGTNPHDFSSSRMFKGLLDDIRIYNRVLSDSEITALFFEGGWVGN
ncbi:MAG: LamG domain-containing protein [Ignavibacteriaceae bacterium]|nr:LamG domain-containing protein [Ignavibacteriaceae bacterium]